MSKRITAGAVQLDADTCNAVDSPVRGCDAGAGLHVVIPGDWQTRIAAGQQVPGCSYHAIDVAGSLTVSDFAIAQLSIPAIVNTLPANLKAQAPLLSTKLLSAVAALLTLLSLFACGIFAELP